MTYQTPELLLIGAAQGIVLGDWLDAPKSDSDIPAPGSRFNASSV